MATNERGQALAKGFHNCFGCGPENPIGLRLKVVWDGEKASTEFTPDTRHTGFNNMVHGGILCALLDEVMSYVPFCQDILTVTGKMEARFRRPARPGEPLVISAFMTRRRLKILETKGLIALKDGTVVAEGSATMWVVGREGER